MRDTRLKARALAEQWHIEEEYRQALIREMVRITLAPNSSNREKTAAFRALALASKEEEPKNATVEPEGNRFLEIAERLGIATSIERLPEARSDDNT